MFHFSLIEEKKSVSLSIYQNYTYMYIGFKLKICHPFGNMRRQNFCTYQDYLSSYTSGRWTSYIYFTCNMPCHALNF